MRKLYERQIGRCARLNDFNRLHIAIEARATPGEARELAALIPERFGETPGVRWIGALHDFYSLSGKVKPEPYFRRRVGPNLYLYTDGRPQETKTLIVGFAGGAARLMMPVSVLLQHLNAAEADLLLIPHRGPAGYNEGVPGLATDFPGFVSALDAVIRKTGYRRRVAFGTSAGGLPALLAAVYLHFDRGVSVGSAAFNPVLWKDVLDDPKFREAISDGRGRPELLGVFSDLNERDRDAATDLGKRLPLVLCPVHERGHNTLLNLLRSQRLAMFLSLTLMSEWSEGRPRINPGS